MIYVLICIEDNTLGGAYLEDPQDHMIWQGNEQAAATSLYGEKQNSIKRRRTVSNRRHMKRKPFYVAVGLLMSMLILVGTILMIYTQDQNKIVKGVTISEIDIGNLTEIQAKELIDNEIHRLLSQTVKLNAGQESPEVTLEYLGLSLNADLALQ